MLEMRAIELKNELEVLKELCIAEVISNGVDGVDERGFKALQSTLKVIKLSNDLMVEQSKAMDEMNEKLDKLLDKVNKRDRDV
jgi:hypothetical protein